MKTLKTLFVTACCPAGWRGVVTTFEDNYPSGIKTDQAWIGETPVGGWYYAPGYKHSAAVIHNLLECVSRDGYFAVNIPMRYVKARRSVTSRQDATLRQGKTQRYVKARRNVTSKHDATLRQNDNK